MPDIITPGDPAKGRDHWTYRVVWHCHTCGCRFRLLPADRPEMRYNPEIRQDYARHECPCCHMLASVTKRWDGSIEEMTGER